MDDTSLLNFKLLRSDRRVMIRQPNRRNVAYGLLTVGGVLTVLNIKTNAFKCSTAGIFLTKGITQHFSRYIIYTVAQLQILQGVVVAAVEYARLCEIFESPAQYIWVNAVRLYSIFPAFIGPFLKQVITNLIL